jgi:toxin ParE1/3/4
MTVVVVTPRARRDIDEIWSYSADLWSDVQAENYIRQLWAAIEFVAADVRRSTTCDDIRQGYRRYAVGSHVVFFAMTEEGLTVVRILHQRMDFRRHLKATP